MFEFDHFYINIEVSGEDSVYFLVLVMGRAASFDQLCHVEHLRDVFFDMALIEPFHVRHCVLSQRLHVVLLMLLL